jgi:hypothetical protein
LVPCLYAGVTCVVREAILCDRACEVFTDFFCGAPNTGDAISAVMVRLLIKAKRLVFIK